MGKKKFDKGKSRKKGTPSKSIEFIQAFCIFINSSIVILLYILPSSIQNRDINSLKQGCANAKENILGTNSLLIQKSLMLMMLNMKVGKFIQIISSAQNANNIYQSILVAHGVDDQVYFCVLQIFSHTNHLKYKIRKIDRTDTSNVFSIKKNTKGCQKIIKQADKTDFD